MDQNESDTLHSKLIQIFYYMSKLSLSKNSKVTSEIHNMGVNHSIKKPIVVQMNHRMFL